MEPSDKFEVIQRAIAVVNKEIDRLEEEYLFLIEENKKNNIRSISEATREMLKDSKFKKLFGEEVAQKLKDSTDEFLGGDFLDKKVWNESMDNITNTLIELHEKQILNYGNLEKFMSESETKGILSNEFDEPIYSCDIIQVKKAYGDMIKIYKKTRPHLKRIYNQEL